MTEVYKISIGRKELYSKDYKLVKRTNHEKRHRVNISRSLVEILSMIIKEDK